MLLPLPAPPVQVGPPTEYARRCRPWMLALLVFQSIVCVVRIVPLMDIMGGFIMLITLALGWYAWKEDMHITFISSWGLLCLINGAFDLVRLIDFAVKTSMPLFSLDQGFWYNFFSAEQICIPASSLAGALLAWFIHKDYSVQEMPVHGFGGAETQADYGAFPQSHRHGAAADAGYGIVGRTMNAEQTKPFAGQGHRLGAN